MTKPAATEPLWTDHAVRVRDEECAARGEAPEVLFRRNHLTGALFRASGLPERRAHIYAGMRAWRHLGMRLSYPEIAAACDLRSHATIITALQRHGLFIPDKPVKEVA